MPIPPSIKQLMPSLRIEGDLSANAKVTCSLADLQSLLNLALAATEIDEPWYLRQYPDVQDGIAKGTSASAAEHYRHCGFLEGRLPADPEIDEEWYRASNPDVAVAIRQGKYRDAKAHYVESGYREGRRARPSGVRSTSRVGLQSPAATLPRHR